MKSSPTTFSFTLVLKRASERFDQLEYPPIVETELLPKRIVLLAPGSASEPIAVELWYEDPVLKYVFETSVLCYPVVLTLFSNSTICFLL